MTSKPLPSLSGLFDRKYGNGSTPVEAREQEWRNAVDWLREQILKDCITPKLCQFCPLVMKRIDEAFGGKEMNVLSKNEEAIDEIVKMIEELSGEDALVDARINSLMANHFWKKHLIPQFRLTPSQATDITWSLGRTSQLGILFALLKILGRWTEKDEADAQQFMKEAEPVEE